MQGYLSMWTGVLTQWRRFYFILHNDVLTFCTQKAGQKQGSIHLKIASIVSVIDDPLKINIHTGTHIIFIRANLIKQRIDWMKAITAAQQEILNNDLSLQMRRLESDGARGYQVVDKRMKSLDSLVAELWNSQAEFEDLVTQLIPRLQRNNASVRICQKIVETTNNIKYKTSDILNIIEQIRVSNREKPQTGRQDISYLSQKRKMAETQQPVQNLLPVLMKNNSLSMDEYQSFDRGYDVRGINKNVSIDQYNSFEKVPGGISLQKINQISNQSQYMSFDRNAPPVSMKLLRKISEQNSFSSFKQYDKKPPKNTGNFLKKPNNQFNMEQKCSNSYKNSLVNRNIVFIQYPIERQNYRLSLPASVSPDLKINIMSILKDSIGADLTKISLPVSLNQPLSILQKGAEQMYYSSLLDEANKFQQPVQRLLYVVAFVVSQYSLTINKTKKPFNPLLGQTFQYIDEKRKFRYLSEQVSHHPPISAMQCTSDNYQYFMNSKGSTSFRGASIKMNPQCGSRIVLKKNKDTIVFNKCTTSLNNLIVGTLYVDNYGELTFKMYNSEQIICTADITFSESSMWGNTQYKVSGVVKDKKGQQFKVDGRWNQGLSYTDSKLGITKEIWSLTHKTLPENYYFNELATNLNNVNYQLLDIIAPTDSRLRPDQRALQYGNKELAATQKQRLEQQQRERRKIMQSKGEHHNPLWFDEVLIRQSGEKEWVSNSKYWEERKQQNWESSEEIF